MCDIFYLGTTRIQNSHNNETLTTTIMDDDNTRGWDNESKAELRRLIEDEQVDPHNSDAPYIKRVWQEHFDYLKLKNFYANYRHFVKKFTAGKRKEGARRREAEKGKKSLEVT